MSQPSPTFEEWWESTERTTSPFLFMQKTEMRQSWDASAARFAGVVEERDRLLGEIDEILIELEDERAKTDHWKGKYYDLEGASDDD